MSNKLLINEIIELELNEEQIEKYLNSKNIPFKKELIEEVRVEKIRRIENSYYVHSLS